MAIKVHGSVISTPVLRVMACLHEKSLPFDFVDVDMRSGDHKKPPFLLLNPFGAIPAFEDGDFSLFESRAITRYIANEYAGKGTPLVPSGAKEAAVAEVWAEVEAQRYDRVASALARELVIYPIFGRVTDEAVVEEKEAELGKLLDVYEARLSHSKYLGGDAFTLADLHHLPTINYLMATRAKAVFEARPHVAAWAAEILARPSWQKVVAFKNDHATGI